MSTLSFVNFQLNKAVSFFSRLNVLIQARKGIKIPQYFNDTENYLLKYICVGLEIPAACNTIQA